MFPKYLHQQRQLAKADPLLPTAQIPVARPLSVQEAADYFNVHHATVRRWISAGKLRAYNIGPRQIRIDPQDLQKFREQIAPSTYDNVNGGGQ